MMKRYLEKILFVIVVLLFAFGIPHITSAASNVGYLKIIKETSGGDGTFDFDIEYGAFYRGSATSPTNAVSITTTQGTGSSSLLKLSAGYPYEYTVAEKFQSGWAFDYVACDTSPDYFGPDAAGNANITIFAGQTTTCVFHNTKLGSTTQTGNSPAKKSSPIAKAPSIIGSTIGSLKNISSRATAAIGVTTGCAGIASSVNTAAVIGVGTGTGGGTGSGGSTGGTGTGGTGGAGTGTTTACLRIVKNTIGGDGTFTFDVNPTPATVTVNTSGNYGSVDVPVTAGTYDIIELVPQDWNFSSVSCNKAGYQVTTNGVTGVPVGPGLTVCTFIDSQQGFLKISKNTIGGDGTFTFNMSPTLSPQTITTSGGKGQTQPIAVDPQTSYSITEIIPGDWNFGSASCDDGSSTKSDNGVTGIIVAPGAVVTCAFTDTKNTQSPPSQLKGYIQLITETDGSFGSFNYTIEGPTNTTTTVNATSSAAEPFDYHDFEAFPPSFNRTGFGLSKIIEVNPGIFNIEQAMPNGWKLASQAPKCNRSFTAYANTSAVKPNALENVVVETGKTTICAFYNTKDNAQDATSAANQPNPPSQESQLVIVKNFSSKFLKYEDAKVYEIFNYTVTGPSSFNRNIVLNSGNHYYTQGSTGAFGNPYNAGFTISSSSINQFSSFGLPAPEIFANPIPVKPGSYTIEEQTPAGWTLNYAYCDGPYTKGLSGVTNVIIEPGKTTTCTFDGTNNNIPRQAKVPSLGYLEVKTVGDESFNYTISPSQTYSQFSNESSNIGGVQKNNDINGSIGYSGDTGAITYMQGNIIGSGSTGPIGLDARFSNYSIKVTGANSADCDREVIALKNQPDTLIYVPIITGQTTTCTFSKLKEPPTAPGYLHIVVNTIGGNGTFHFAIQSFFSDYTFYTVGSSPANSQKDVTSFNGTGSELIGLDSGRKLYTIQQKSITGISGWSLNSASCDDGTAYPILRNDIVSPYSFNIASLIHVTIPHGGTTTCTFNYTKNVVPGYLRLVAKTIGGDATFNYTVFPTPTTATITTVNGMNAKTIRVTPGTVYNIGEIVPSGWGLTFTKAGLYGSGLSPSCVAEGSSKPMDITNVTVLSGQTTTCTFLNEAESPAPIPSRGTTGTGSATSPESLPGKPPDIPAF